MNRSDKNPTSNETRVDYRHRSGRPFAKRYVSAFCLALLGSIGCSDDTDDDPSIEMGGASGAISVGGRTASGGAHTTGGTATAGGTRSSSGGSATTGGTVANAGAPEAGGGTSPGGATSNGGAPVTAGTSSNGGSTMAGGAAAVGGTSSVGGATTAAGAPANGGAAAVGGTSSVGGATTAAGAPANGGAAAVGGTSSDGGATTVAGAPANGGAATVGGATAVAGATAMAGAAAVGGATTAAGAPANGGAATAGGAGPEGGTTTNGGATTNGGSTSVNPPTPGPILQYNFDVDTDTKATDSTTNGNNGTLTNVTLTTTGRNVGGVHFAATDSQIAMPAGLLTLANELSVSAWVNMAANNPENRLFTFSNGAASHLYLTFNNSDSTPGISLRFLAVGGVEQVLTTPTQLPLNVWKHVTVTMSSAGTAIHVDGKVVAQSATLIIDPKTLGTTNGDFVGNSETGANAFQGEVDEFYVYNLALPRADILTLAAPKTDYLAYHFDEGTGTMAMDASSKHKDGTLVGPATWVPGLFGGALKLDNQVPSPVPTTNYAEQYVNLGPGLLSDCGANLTVAGWVNIETNRLKAAVFSSGLGTTKLIYLGTAYKTTTDIVYQMQVSAGWKTARTTQTWTLNQWYHIAAVRSGNGSTVTNYINGVPIVAAVNDFGTTVTEAVSSWGATDNNYFGKQRNDQVVSGWDGTIDEFVVSCRAYTDSEIKQLAYKP